ncbi:MAG TPA: signal peptidase I [Bacteroidia bacterium]
MKPKYIVLIIILCVLPIVLLVGARLLKVFVTYSIPTVSMDPTFAAGMNVFGSSLPGVEKGDIVSYKPNQLPGESYDGDFIGRIVADEGDTVEMYGDCLYIDGSLTDDTLKYAYLFVFDKMDLKTPLSTYQEQHRVFPHEEGNFIFNGTYNELKKLGIERTAHRVCYSIETKPETFGVHSDSTWTLADMGPIVVPPGHYFIMGDNRSNSLDGRARGFVPADKIVAKILTGN